MNIAETIIELCSMAGPSGFETAVGKRLGELMAPYVDEIKTDVMGNVIGVKKCGKENAKKLLFDAHMDEIGFIVTGVEEGFLRFATLGGVDSRMLPASEVIVLTEPPITGVIATMPVHVLKPGESDNAVKTEDLVIDIGMSQEKAEELVPLGTPVIYGTGVRRLGKDMICGKSLDDRSCVASILYALEMLKDKKLNVDLYVLFSTQEEVGLRGARTGGYSVNPDWCVAVDVGFAKTPDCKTYQTKELGGGVVIGRGPNMNRKLTELAVSLAKKREIKYQIGVEPEGNSGTNAAVLQIAREGAATALFSLPLKYMHTPVEVISMEDVETTAKLLCAVAESLDGGEENA